MISGKEKTEFRKTKVWKDFRLLLLKERGFRCECCGIQRLKGLNIHHIFPEDYDNLDPTKYAVLCSSCHEEVSRLERIKHYENYNEEWLSLFGRFVGKWIYSHQDGK